MTRLTAIAKEAENPRAIRPAMSGASEIQRTNDAGRQSFITSKLSNKAFLGEYA